MLHVFVLDPFWFKPLPLTGYPKTGAGTGQEPNPNPNSNSNPSPNPSSNPNPNRAQFAASSCTNASRTSAPRSRLWGSTCACRAAPRTG